MKIASVAEVKSQFSAFLKASEAGPVVVTRNGRPVAAIIAVQDEDEIERLLMEYSPHLRAILDRSRQQFREGEWLSEEDFWSQFEDAQPSDESAGAKKKRVRAKGKGRQKGSEVEAAQVEPEDKKVKDNKGRDRKRRQTGSTKSLQQTGHANDGIPGSAPPPA
jgi:prevent-host-death family protein